MLKWNQDHHLRWKLTNKNPIICQIYYIDHFTEEEKHSDNCSGSDSNKNESICSKDDMFNEGSHEEIDENVSQQEVSSRLKQKEIWEKLRFYYDAIISTTEVIRKNITTKYE